MPTEELAMSLRKISRTASIRIAEAAFEEATARKMSGQGAGRVTAVHKANVLRMTDGLFLVCTREVARRYPEIAYDERIVDAMCAHLIRHPGEFDVVCTTNMFGDILSDMASELAGSLGLAASLNFGVDFAMAQAQHGSAPDIAERNIANPTSLIGSAAMLLGWIGRRNGSPVLRTAAARIETAIDAALAEPELRTPDLGGRAGTDRFASAVAERIVSAGKTQ
jgi:3-isopropylmalate dehydrogenase